MNKIMQVLVILIFHLSVCAADHYQVIKEVDPAIPGAEEIAIREALTEVLKRVGGEQLNLQQAKIKAALKNAKGYLLEYSYEALPDDGIGYKSLMLSFDPVGIKNLLSQTSAASQPDNATYGLWIKVNNVASLMDYGAVESYLLSQEALKKTHIVKVEGTTVWFTAATTVPIDYLADKLSSSQLQWLHSFTDEQNKQILEYRLITNGN